MSDENFEGVEQSSELVTYGEFKGRPTISLKQTPDDKYPFSMGVVKARLCVENIEVLEAFVNKYKK